MRLRLTGRVRVRPRTHAREIARDLLDGGWALVAVLSVTVTASYGVLMYGFPVMLAPMQAELGWSTALLTSGFSAAMLVAGVVAIPVGSALDRYGPRAVMTTGSAAAVVLLLAWSRVDDPVSYLIVWIGLGACMAAVFYEPVFAVIARHFCRSRASALSIITISGGLASTIFVPLSSRLVDAAGWRDGVVWLAIALGTLTIVPHFLLPRTPRARHVEYDDARATDPIVPRFGRQAFRNAQFRWLAAAMFLSAAVNFALTVHLIPLLLERGATAAQAASALALLGLAKLPGRALIAPLISRASARTAIVAACSVQILGLLMLGIPGHTAATWIFIGLFGAGDGATTPARGELLAELSGPAEYGRVGGLLGFVVALGRFWGPIGASLAGAVLGGYAGLRWILVLALAVAVIAMTRLCPAGALEEQPGDAYASFSGGHRLSV